MEPKTILVEEYQISSDKSKVQIWSTFLVTNCSSFSNAYEIFYFEIVPNQESTTNNNTGTSDDKKLNPFLNKTIPPSFYEIIKVSNDRQWKFQLRLF